MRRSVLVLGFALLFVLAWAGMASAGELGLDGKVVYQIGNYAFTFLRPPADDGDGEPTRY